MVTACSAPWYFYCFLLHSSSKVEISLIKKKEKKRLVLRRIIIFLSWSFRVGEHSQFDTPNEPDHLCCNVIFCAWVVSRNIDCVTSFCVFVSRSSPLEWNRRSRILFQASNIAGFFPSFPSHAVKGNFPFAVIIAGYKSRTVHL